MNRTKNPAKKGRIDSDAYVKPKRVQKKDPRGHSAQTYLDDTLNEGLDSLWRRSGMGKLAFLAWLIAWAVEHDHLPGKEK